MPPSTSPTADPAAASDLVARGLAARGQAAVEALASALEADPDRYVRGYAAEALVSVLLLSGRVLRRAAGEGSGGGRDGDVMRERAREALATAFPQQVLNAALSDAGGLDDRERDAHGHARCRWLCAQRWCPLTTPISPF